MVPAEVYIEIDHYSYRMRKDGPDAFSYHFKNVLDDTPFKIYAGPVSSQEMTLSVIKKPGILTLDIGLDYPSYTGRKDEELRNIGDLVVPEGLREDRSQRRGDGASCVESRNDDGDLWYQLSTLVSYGVWSNGCAAPGGDSVPLSWPSEELTPGTGIAAAAGPGGRRAWPRRPRSRRPCRAPRRDP